MILLENALRSNGVTKIPITANDVYPSGDFAAGPGEVDLYGFDAYPNGFDCANPSQWSELPNYFVSAHESSAPWAPMYLPEYQGGALDSWAGDGYDLCEQLTGPEFANVFYKSNVAFGSTAMSFYMIFGGTNWGNIAYPGVYTSYDYGGAIRETRLLTPKYNEIKLQGLFYHSSPSLLSSSIIGNGAGLPFTDNDEIFTTTLVSNTNETSYYVLRQTSNNITSPTSFHLNINTTMGTIRVPQYGGEITLQGRESKILVSEYQFGGSTLRYSTAEVMTHLTLDDIDYIVLYVLPGQYFEAVVLGSAISASKVTGALSVSARIVKNTVVISGTPSTKSPSLVRFGNTAVIILDKFTATSFWNPRLSATYDLSPDSPSVLIGGPYLVRNATVSGSTLNLVGDTNATTTLTIVAPRLVKSVTWNGDIVNISASPLGLGVVGIVPGPDALLLPNLRTSLWKSMDSLPEVNPNFDDSTWVTADKTSTARQQKPYSGKFVLYADEYGFHTGSFVYRGYFNGNFATGVNISAQGGSYFGFSVFVNAHFLGSNQGYVGADTANSTFSFPAGSLTNQNNVLTVITDSNGLDTDWNSNDLFKNPRGIRGYSLLGGGEFYQWKLSGNFRGEDFPDKVRGPLNEGGLWAERSGAVLPGYDDSEWGSSTPFEGVSKAGVSVYRTSFELNVPPGVDTSLALQFTRSPASDSEYRSLIYVNGWQFGKFISNFGPQTIFPVPEGILNHHGQNQIAVTLWSLSKSRPLHRSVS
ncbi:hypothetical protein PHLCEN_2v29 [Hermanssonia centrifuga]|uniref:beta-galactosidase n=1 Tax=Hermanssonia centrifuga TaxID=98765 RepID=A0A2R6S797_9APHY|nr:hypothetical protein PHLCEN_2v29 [Hermanssonia centrifuga]